MTIGSSLCYLPFRGDFCIAEKFSKRQILATLPQYIKKINIQGGKNNDQYRNY